MSEHACGLGINGKCVRRYPSFVRMAVAYRVLWSIVPSRVLGFLGKGFDRALVAGGVVVPAGVDLPGGWVVFPDVVFPDGWVLGDPLPPGVFGPPRVSPLLPDAGPSEPLFIGLFSGGAVHRVSSSPIVSWTEFFNDGYWEEVVVPGYELGSIRWVTDHWKVYYCEASIFARWGTLRVKTGETWADGFRPSKCRVTFSGESGTVQIAIVNSDASVIGQNLSAVSPAEISLNFSGGKDIYELRICDAIEGSHSARSFYITNIEFSGG